METLSECLILVDNTNIFIEGMKFAARQKGLQATIPGGSTPPPNDSVWEAARKHNFEVKTYEEGWEMELWGFRDSISLDLSMMAHRTHFLDSVFDKIGKFQSN
ncbi:MAG: hypothetical protein LBD53_02600 [Tannerella sp.]|jgi:hypothetical protein|nr:hypothetical protein [Tannerella sp.]